MVATPSISQVTVPSPVGLDFAMNLGDSNSRGTLLLTGANPVYSMNPQQFLTGLYSQGAGGALACRMPARRWRFPAKSAKACQQA